MIEFKSFAAFARHLEKTALEGPEVTHRIATEGAKLITQDAQERIGFYQDQTGPFNAWAPLAESTVADRVAKGFTPNDPLLRTGDLRASIFYEVEGPEAVVGSESEIAKYQEFGTSTIPPRPFLWPAAFASKAEISAKALETVVAWVCGLGWKRPTKRLTSEAYSIK